MNLVAKFKLPAVVPVPPTGSGTIFIDSADTMIKVKLPNGTLNTLQGPQGLKGDTGTPATITIGSVTTKPSGTSPEVTNAGTSAAVVLNFKLPIPNVSIKTQVISFANKDTTQRVVITDASVSSTAIPFGFSFYNHTVTSEANELGYVYHAVLTSVGTGSFVINVSVLDQDGDDVMNLPLPDVTFCYQVNV